MEKKKALIAVNTTGFMWFLMEDIDMLRSMGYDVTVVADDSSNETHTIAEIKRRGARFVDIRGDFSSPLTRTNLDYFKKIRAFVKEQEFDAIVCHTPVPGIMVRAAARISGKRGAKVIYMTHGLPWTHLSSRKTALKFSAVEYIGSLMSDAIITINDEDFGRMTKMGCRNVFKVSGVGCDTAKYRDAAVNRRALRESLGVADDQIVVMAIGMLSPRKNQTTIARAIASLPDPSRYVFVVCGRDLENGIAECLQSIAVNAGFTLHLLGHRSDVHELVHAADIGVMPSLREGLGLGGIQLLCAGVPVVGTAVQGISEYVIDGITGCTVADPYDIKGFADAIKKLSDSTVRESMATDCVRVAEGFGKEIALAQRRAIYEQIFCS